MFRFLISILFFVNPTCSHHPLPDFAIYCKVSQICSLLSFLALQFNIRIEKAIGYKILFVKIKLNFIAKSWNCHNESIFVHTIPNLIKKMLFDCYIVLLLYPYSTVFSIL